MERWTLQAPKAAKKAYEGLPEADPNPRQSVEPK